MPRVRRLGRRRARDSLFACLLIALAALQCCARPTRRTRAASGLVAFGLCITRPEGLAYALGWALLELVRAFAAERTLRPALRASCFFLVPLLLYHVVHYAVFRQLVPNTYLAKPASRDLAGRLLTT